MTRKISEPSPTWYQTASGGRGAKRGSRVLEGKGVVVAAGRAGRTRWAVQFLGRTHWEGRSFVLHVPCGQGEGACGLGAGA